MTTGDKMAQSDLKTLAKQKLDTDIEKLQNETEHHIPEQVEQIKNKVEEPNLKDKPILQRVSNRIHHRDLDYIGIITGERGKGKSYSAIKISELIDKTFNPNRIFFKPIDLIDQIFELYNNNKLKRGMFWVLDEGGVSWGSRTWYEESNLYMNYMAQTFRKLGQGVIITLPYLNLLDVQARRQRNAWMQMEKKGKIRYFRSTRSPTVVRDKEKRKSGGKYDVYCRDNNGNKIKTFKIGLPKMDMSKYEKKKDKFLFDVLGRDIKSSEVDEQKILDLFVEKAWEDKEKFIVKSHIDKSIIKFEFGLKGEAASYVKAKLTQKLKKLEEDDNSNSDSNSNSEKDSLTEREKIAVTELYENTDYTQKEVADKFDITRQYVSKLWQDRK